MNGSANDTKAGLMITLGHNSSALFYDQIGKPIGYEEERLTGKKSDSSFPEKSINMILKNIDNDRLIGGKIFVSHWFDIFNHDNFPEKYYNKDIIDELCKDYSMSVVFLTKNFTHHDAHMYSSKAFLENNIKPTQDIGDMHYIVADGFGNNKEVLSIYRQPKGSNSVTLQDRFHGYEFSLGLMYQYATSFCGMKENQDEYKFLGYESQITEITSKEQIDLIDILIKDNAQMFLEDLYLDREERIPEDTDKYLDFEGLKNCKVGYHLAFQSVVDRIKIFDDILVDKVTIKRILIGYYIQGCVEHILSELIGIYDIKNVALSGGCFYNVKLNNSVLKQVEGYTSVVPVAGDQGAGIGMYEATIGGFRFYDLCYGVRNLDKNIDASENKRIMMFDNEDDFVSKAIELINEDKIVNIVCGEMEFGPRALCNTSTLALPTKRNVEFINYMNDRNTVMPMAPVILSRNVAPLFEDREMLNRVIGSNNYMIMTHDFGEDAVNSGNYQGVMHVYPDLSSFSGRPQIVESIDEKPIGKILDKVKALCLINTSFNTHGTPILFSVKNAIDDFNKQCLKDRNQNNYLLILNA